MDSDMMWTVGIILAVVAAFGLILWFSIQAEKRRFEALQAMAAERGWTVRRERFDRARGFVVTPAEGNDWELEVRRSRSASGAGSRSAQRGGRRGSHGITRVSASGSGRSSAPDPGRAEFRAARPVLPGGLAIFASGAPGGGTALGEAASSLLGLFDNKIGKAMLSRVLGPDMGEHVGALQSFPAPEGSNLTVMATADPSMWFDVAAIGKALAGWQPLPGHTMLPQVAIGEAGLRLFIPREVTDPAAVARLVELGLELRACAARSAPETAQAAG